jgi:anti-sigma regulatory factor (Ser/Thr protein kinase)
MHVHYPCPGHIPTTPPVMSLEHRFPKTIDSLQEVFTFLDGALTSVTNDAHVRQTLAFATEEFFTNCVKYNRKSTNDILVRIVPDDSTVRIQIIDEDVEPFDVTKAAPPDLNTPASSRRVGGLGIHLSRELLDDLSYEYSGNTSIITMTMNLLD